VLRQNTTSVNSVQAAAAATGDIVITAVLCYLLNDSRTGVGRTNTIINKLIKYAINRGAMTSVCALLNLVFFVSLPETFVFMVPLLPSGQLYVISVVSMLLARHGLRDRAKQSHETTAGSFPLTSIHVSNNGHSFMHQDSNPAEGIQVQKQVLTWRDD
jgi:hypothetical protein